MFSAKHSLADMRECNLIKKQKLNKNRGWFARMQKGVFFGHFFGFGGFVFFYLCFCAFVLLEIAQNGYFPAFLEGFLSILFPQKACLKVFLFFLFCFFLLWSSLSQIHFYICFLSINPFYTRLFVGFFSFSFACLSFPKVCLFIWHKLS